MNMTFKMPLTNLQILRDRGYLLKERGVIQVKGKGEMLTSYVLGRKISRKWHFGRTVSSGNNSLAEVVYGIVRNRKRRTGRRGRHWNHYNHRPISDHSRVHST